MKGWYKAAVDRMPLPTWVTPNQIMVELFDLYRQVPPPGENIPVSVKLFQVEDLVPTEDEIERVVRQIWKNRSGGPSGMKSEHLKEWLEEVRKEELTAEKAAEGAEAAIGGPRGGSAPSSRSISSPASSVRRLLFLLRIALIARPRRWMRAWSLDVPRIMETLSSTSLHVSAKIHVFFLASWAFGLGMDLRRAVKSPSSLVSVVGGQRGGAHVPPEVIGVLHQGGDVEVS